jgi:hypothetical protein
MKLRYLIPALAMALSVHAEPEVNPQPAVPGEIILTQYTRVDLKDGKPIKTSRYMDVKMRDPNGVRWNLNPTASWSLSTRGTTTPIDHMKWNGAPSWRTGDPIPIDMDLHGAAPRKNLDHAIIGKRTEDGIDIVGEWSTFEMGPTKTKARWIERRETWWRAAASGEKKIRKHRSIVESPYRKEITDYFYVQSTRLHPSLFSAEDNPPLP